MPKRRLKETNARYLSARARSSGSALVSNSASAATRSGCCSAMRIASMPPHDRPHHHGAVDLELAERVEQRLRVVLEREGRGTSLLPWPGPSNTSTRPSSASGPTWCFHMLPSKSRLGQSTTAGAPSLFGTPRSWSTTDRAWSGRTCQRPRVRDFRAEIGAESGSMP